MNAMTLIALYGAIPLCILAFALMKNPRHAVLLCFIGAWMFLPVAALKMKGIPDLTKITATSFGVLLGAMIFDIKTLLKFRPKWYDIPMFVMVFSPYVTSLKNDLGAYDGSANIFYQAANWGIPYFIGRCYFKDWEGFRELGIAILIGGIIYIPFCALEMRISPQLHKIVYGKHAHAFNQELRWGGYRPQVFMQSGLAVGMWMMAASLIGVWLYVSGSLKKLWGFPMEVILPILVLTAIFCKASAAIMFLFAGIGTLLWIKYTRNAIPLLIIMAVAPIYMYQRTTLHWDGEAFKAYAYKSFGAERGQSFETRIDAENKLTQNAMDAPDKWYGWGKWDPNDSSTVPWRVYKEYHHAKPAEDHTIYALDKKTKQVVRKSYITPGEVYVFKKDDAITDGLWVITLGTFGIIGLAALNLSLITPAIALMVKVPLRFWGHPMVAVAAAVAVLGALDMCDNILNGMLNPVFVLALGGVSAVGPSVRKMVKAQRMGYAPAGFANAGNGGYAGAAPARPVATPGYAAAPRTVSRAAPVAFQQAPRATWRR